jgi:hypothetical protein
VEVNNVEVLFRQIIQGLEELKAFRNDFNKLLREQNNGLDRPTIGRKEDVQRLLDCSSSTIDRRREDSWHEGIHWWKEGGRVLFNLVLIEDWLVNQNDPAAHERAIDQWVKRLPSNQSKKKKAR